jgi:hypothetical protein
VVTSFNGESLPWNAGAYAKASRIDGTQAQIGPEKDLVFKEINAYLATLSQAKQQRIWDAYKKIHAIVTDTQALLDAKGRLQDLIKNIYDEINYDDLRAWSQTSRMISVPLTIKADYEDNDLRETTYLRREYIDLLILAIACRLMVPVWSEYMLNIRDQVSNTTREYEAVKLLYKSDVMKWEPYTRFHRYMQRSITNKAKASTLQSVTLSGISTDEFSDWLLANTLVRRTCVAPLDTTHEGPNIVTDAYAYVSSTLRSTGHKRFAGSITDKESHRNEKSEQKESPAEAYKIKQQIADGETVQASVYAHDHVEELVYALAPDMDADKLRLCLKSMEDLADRFLPQAHQIVLTQWVNYTVINPGYARTIQRAALLRLMAGTQAILWHWGFHDLAALVTATELHRSEDEFLSMQESWSKIPNDLMERMQQIYPHALPTKVKQATLRQSNAGALAVESFYRLLTDRDWMLTCPPALFVKTTHVANTRKMYVPSDIRTQLATLLIRLYEERKAFRARRQDVLEEFPEDDHLVEDEDAPIRTAGHVGDR